MKSFIIQYIAFICGLLFLSSCTPDDFTYYNNEEVDPGTIDSIVLMPNQSKLIADGNAQLELCPLLFNKMGYQIPDSRVKEEWLEYITPSGLTLNRYFSTNDVSLIGKTITAQVRIKGTEILSESASFQIVAPLEEKYTSDIIIPIVFHVIQTNEEIESYGGEYDRDKIKLLLQKLNNLFAGTSTVNPVGVNTHISFEMARFDPEGQEMQTPGINRLTLQTMDASIKQNNFADFLEQQHLVWPADQYMNIWLISDRKGLVRNFYQISDDCGPHYVYPGTSIENRPEGITWKEFPADGIFLPKEAGIIYKLQELDEIVRNYSSNGISELAFYVGRYFGLFKTWVFNDYYQQVGNDYCDDTIDYLGEYYKSGITNFNHTIYKTMNNCYFRAENIMDDYVSLHISVSKNQCERIRWVLENCPERSAWKSNFAFTGK